MKRTAIVIDSSASIGPLLELFTLDTERKPIVLRNTGSGFDCKKLYELMEQFDKVYLFTDGYIELTPNWEVILTDKLRVIRIDQP